MFNKSLNAWLVVSSFIKIGGFLKNPVVQGCTAICGAVLAGYMAIFPSSLKTVATSPKTDISFNAPVANVNTGTVNIQKIENQVVNTIASDASLQALIGELKNDSKFFKDQILLLQKEKQVSALALISILKDVGKNDVNDANALLKVSEVIEDYKQLQKLNASIEGDSAKVIELKKQADVFFANGQLNEAQKLYEQIEYAYTNDSVNRSKAVSVLAQIAHAQLLYLDEADYYRRAAALLPLDVENEQSRIGHLRAEAGAFFQYGIEYGDQDALFNAADISQDNLQNINKQTHLKIG